MIAVHGAHNTAKCFCKTLEPQARQQIQMVCDQQGVRRCKNSHYAGRARGQRLYHRHDDDADG